MNWLIIIGMTFITFLNRYAFFTQWVRYQPNQHVRRFLGYSSYAILTAIWAPIIFSYDIELGFRHAGIDYVVAAIVAILLTTMRLPSIVVVLISTGLFFCIRFVL